MKDLVDSGAATVWRSLNRPSHPAEAIDASAERATSEEAGRLSNPARWPVQRRLRGSEVDELAARYEAGSSLRAIAEAFGVHHRTVAAHLEQLGVPRRLNRRKMNAQDIIGASRRYEPGDSLATVAIADGVGPATVRREVHRADVAIRPRRGWA